MPGIGRGIVDQRAYIVQCNIDTLHHDASGTKNMHADGRFERRKEDELGDTAAPGRPAR